MGTLGGLQESTAQAGELLEMSGVAKRKLLRCKNMKGILDKRAHFFFFIGNDFCLRVKIRFNCPKAQERFLS